MSNDIATCRADLRHVIAAVRQFKEGINLYHAWVYHASTGQWEFHFQEFYWAGHAANAFDARAKGWAAWLTKQGAKGWAV